MIAHDLHPEYLSTKYTIERGVDPAVTLVGIQHHHAHVASCLVDNAHIGPAIGVALDGLGYGEDGTLWGGEVLVADLVSFERVGHFESRHARRGDSHPPALADGRVLPRPGLRRRRPRETADPAAPRRGLGTGRSAGPGRAGERADLERRAALDTVSAIVCGRDTVNYEGQAAVELEQLADPRERSSYPVPVEDAGSNGRFRVMVGGLVRLVVADMEKATEPALIAARFHNALAEALVAACRRARELSGLATVALSGGVFRTSY